MPEILTVKQEKTIQREKKHKHRVVEASLSFLDYQGSVWWERNTQEKYVYKSHFGLFQN